MFKLTTEALKELQNHPKLANWYQSYLKSNKWISIRNRVRKRARGKCELCPKWKDKLKSDSENFIVHHLTYERVTKELLRDLMYLCRDCHKQVHTSKIIPYSERIYDENYQGIKEWS